ncbi:MAG: AmmeMemoRadiSam system protein B [Anaerolineae bacterium]|nr:AmmeMemoRadiSam system protein B [Anaerolineae bacterium]
MRARPETIRRSPIAGSWYPGAERSLAKTVDGYLQQIDEPPIEGELIALVSPHAGYAYSGQTAAYAYRQLEGRAYDAVVLLGPSHRAWVGDYAVSAEDAYQTPLGLVPVDHDLIAALAEQVPLRQIEGDAEHALEIQLPFLQRQLDVFSLVPILMSADTPAAAERLATALVGIIHNRAAAGRRTLLVASSDLHHIENYADVVRRDQTVVEAVAAYDLDALRLALMAPGSTVCGRMPILTVMHAGRALGADHACVLHHTNSGDVTGQRVPGQYTVGYMAAAVYRAL